jgi:sugar lactone lactonase YvrE
MNQTRACGLRRTEMRIAVLAIATFRAAPAGAGGPQGIAAGADGAFYVTDAARHTVSRIGNAGELPIVAGKAGQLGDDNGSGAAARFDGPAGVAVDAQGNLYLADVNNHMIRKIRPDGEVGVFAGRPGIAGSVDGPAHEARFNGPHGVAVDEAGNVYVADTDNSTIRKIASNGTVSTLAGRRGESGSQDGVGNGATFSFPQDLAVDRHGNIYVADVNAHTIRRIGADGAVSTLAGMRGIPGSADGSGDVARFHFPRGIALDAAGNLYVADSNNRAIRKVTPDGMVSTLDDIAFDAGVDELPVGIAISENRLRVTSHGRRIVDHDLAVSHAGYAH